MHGENVSLFLKQLMQVHDERGPMGWYTHDISQLEAGALFQYKDRLSWCGYFWSKDKTVVIHMLVSQNYMKISSAGSHSTHQPVIQSLYISPKQ